MWFKALEAVLRLFGLLFLLLSSGVALAEKASVEALTTLDTGRAWSAVGRLTINGGEGFCTASLITPSILITAAHCLFDPETEERLDIAAMEFQAGFRNGRAEAYRKIRHATPHPSYRFQNKVTVDRVTSDLALMELEQPIRNGAIIPFQLATTLPAVAQDVGLVSYARGRSEIPSFQKMCEISDSQQGILIMNCDVDFGASGAPVFDYTVGFPRIVSVVSAMAKYKGEKVSLGAVILPLLQGFEEEFGLIIDPSLGVVTQSQDQGKRRQIGAKFSKP